MTADIASEHTTHAQAPAWRMSRLAALAEVEMNTARSRMAASAGDLSGRDLTQTAERIAYLAAKEEALRTLAAKARSGAEVTHEALLMLARVAEELGANPEAGHVQALRGVAAAAKAAVGSL